MLCLMSVLQETAAIQTKCEAAQRELRKTQQLLRQLERQLAKAHMSRKESGSTSQHLQVAFNLTLASADLLQISSHTCLVSRLTRGLQNIILQSCSVMLLSRHGENFELLVYCRSCKATRTIWRSS